MRAVLDTNILIDYLGGVLLAAEEIARYQEPMISPITWMEVMAGAKEEEERRSLRLFLNAFRLVALDQIVMERAALLRATGSLRLPDAIILATALENNLMLVTRNTKDFKINDWPNIRVPYQL